MDIKDAKPTCGCMNRDIPARTCTLPAGHTGLHHWRPYHNALSGSIWDDSLAVWHPDDIDAMTGRMTSAERQYAANRVDALVAERDAYAKQVETLTKERDLARSELDLCTGRLQTAKEEVASLLKRAECSFMNAHQEIELLRASLAATQAELERARQTTDESLPSAGPPCPHSKAKQVGSSSFVVRRCKLADGHDGMCEPV